MRNVFNVSIFINKDIVNKQMNWDFMYPIQLVKVQNFSFDMRDFQSASLKFPEFSDLIQKVEFNSGLCLQT